MSEKELRFGVIGLGRAGSGMLAALAEHPGIRVTAAADLHRQHLDRFQADFGGDVFTDVAALCKSPNIDVVYIATPHGMHVEHMSLAAQHGKHAIVEKPMALTLEDCEAMTQAAANGGVQMVIGHTASFNPTIQKMRTMIASGVVGRLGFISATSYTDFLYRPRRPEELVTELGGGIMYNQVPHQVDAARYVAGGMARSVRAATWVMDPARHTEGAYTAFLDFENGAVATLTYSGYDHFDSTELADGRGSRVPERYGATRRALRAAESPKDEVTMRIDTGYGGQRPVARAGVAPGSSSLLQGELGSFVVTCESADLRMLPEGVGSYTTDGFELIKPEPWRGVQGRGAVIDEMYYAVTEGRSLVHDGPWAKATMEVCLAMLESARTRREVLLEHQVPTRDRGFLRRPG
jgi:phthalate 4,5-cis-dihydrodiol dehydrogenase